MHSKNQTVKGIFHSGCSILSYLELGKKVASQCDGKHLQDPTTKVIRQN